jgi:hypothetical protein
MVLRMANPEKMGRREERDKPSGKFQAWGSPHSRHIWESSGWQWFLQ